MLEAGTVVGNYVVETEFDSGGMARLFRVRHTVLGTTHAMKVLDAAYRARPEVRDRFLSEGRIAAKLNHPNVVRVTDTVSTPEVAGLIMDLIAGPNMEQHIRQLGRRPTAAETRALFLPVLYAVGEAHRQGIIHRDLKPSNILLEPGPHGFVPKVTDFGIAKVTEAAAGMVQKKGSTLAEARMGTLSYMSPEQVRGAKDVTTRSDIFSLGATLYELATGRAAFDAGSDYDIMHKIVQGTFAPPEQEPGVDPALAATIRRALQPDPAARFATCEDFAASLASGVAPAHASGVAPAPRYEQAPAGGFSPPPTSINTFSAYQPAAVNWAGLPAATNPGKNNGVVRDGYVALFFGGLFVALFIASNCS